MDDIVGLQRQISSLDDRVLGQALSMGGEQVPHLMLMMEVARRGRLRSEHPLVEPRPTTMFQEMQAGMYQPVPTPPPKWPDLAGVAAGQPAMPGQSIMQQPQTLDMNKPAGIGSLFSQNR